MGPNLLHSLARLSLVAALLAAPMPRLLMRLQLLSLVVVAAVVPLPVAVLLLAVLVAPAMPSRTPTRQQWKWPLPSTLRMPPTLLTCRLRLRYHARYLRDLLLLHVLQLARVPLERHRFVGNEGK